MTKKIGIPQGLFFYDYYPIFINFFRELGVEVVLSSNSNKKILNQGIANCVDEACLPVKVYHGHVIDLIGKADCIFMPKIISIRRKEYNCPKVLGLPEMVKNSIPDLPQIISPIINLRKSKRNYINSIIEVGRYFTQNTSMIKEAYENAFEKYIDYKKYIYKTKTIPINIIKNYDNYNFNKIINFNKNDLTLLVCGHSYNIFDEYISMNLINKLKEQGINVLTTEMVEAENIEKHIKDLSKRMFWSSGRDIVGASFYLIENKMIDGLIYVSSFGCGLDSILIEMVQRRARKRKIPFTLLTLDEHTGEAGINTRLEAFIDMMKWRNKNEDNISTHG